ncbi:hypothetical protein F5B18DRAFT_652946 [Nemania serpens]|nr:hypothetical protein F5B18DRAFT_652946 [Nemania serpens]
MPKHYGTKSHHCPKKRAMGALGLWVLGVWVGPSTPILILVREDNTLEPLLDVHLTKWTQQQAHGNVTPNPLILRIAIILLELAYLEQMPEAQSYAKRSVGP